MNVGDNTDDTVSRGVVRDESNKNVPTRRSGLRSQRRKDYSRRHSYGEIQLNQMHKVMCKKLRGNKNFKRENGKEKKSIRLETKDMLRRVISITMAQMSTL